MARRGRRGRKRQPGGYPAGSGARSLAAELFPILRDPVTLARATGLTGSFLITGANGAAAEGGKTAERP